jgi:hypothetical protein
MGSYSQSLSSTSAVDKRQVTSENAIGQSVDGNSNIIGGQSFSTLLNSSVNMLDGGAVNAAFDFANKSLSSVLALAINREKTSEAAAIAVQDSAAASIAQIGQTAAQTAAAAETQTANYKKWLLVAIGLGGVYWLWSKK